MDGLFCFTVARYSAQVGAAVVVFIVTWIVLPTSDESVVRLDPQDGYKFRVSTHTNSVSLLD